MAQVEEVEKQAGLIHTVLSTHAHVHTLAHTHAPVHMRQMLAHKAEQMLYNHKKTQHTQVQLMIV